jgi:predicted nucleotidyltransferase
MDIWLRYNGHMTELGVLARELGVHERTLRRAVSEGALHGDRPTARTLALPLSERRYVRRKWPLLSKLREALRTEQNVRFALLFGSAATGSDTPGSDVDVLVDLRDASLDRMVDLSSKLTKIVGRRVDAVRLQDAEAEPAFLLNVVADGRVLVDREHRWARLRRHESIRGSQGQLQHSMRARAALSGIDRLLGA